MMDAAVLHAFGQPPRFEQFPEPIPADGEVLVRMLAASLKPLDRGRASGQHYASGDVLPVVCGLDGVGRLDDGTRVFCAAPRSPFGTMATWTVVPRRWCFAVPDALDTLTAAALPNPAMSAWLALAWRGKLAANETVLILGATGVAGRLAVQIARLLGAGRIVGAGRDPAALAALPALGADAMIQVDQSDADLTAAFVRDAGSDGYDVVIDYLWGRPTEALLAALTRSDLERSARRTRLVQVGAMADPTISLPASALRGSRVELLGSGSASLPDPDVLTGYYRQMIEHALAGDLSVETEAVPLSDVEAAWQRVSSGRRLVLVP